MSKPVTITGSAGRLEGLLARASRNTERAAVLCHPHPQFGGTMQDAVLDTVSDVFLAEGIDCLRFNFRGVGNSQGAFDNGRGETQDAVEALGWARANIQHTNELWLAGYSFGANIAWRTGQETDDLDRLFLIAPPFGRMDFEGEMPNIPVHIIAGDADEYIDWDALNAWMAGRPQSVTLTKLAGADHFFTGTMDALTKAVRAAARIRND